MTILFEYDTIRRPLIFFCTAWWILWLQDWLSEVRLEDWSDDLGLLGNFLTIPREINQILLTSSHRHIVTGVCFLHFNYILTKPVLVVIQAGCFNVWRVTGFWKSISFSSSASSFPCAHIFLEYCRVWLSWEAYLFQFSIKKLFDIIHSE